LIQVNGLTGVCPDPAGFARWNSRTSAAPGESGFAIRTALDMSGRVPRSAARPPAYQPRNRYVVDEEPVYYEPPSVYYDGPYYRPYWGWRHRW